MFLGIEIGGTKLQFGLGAGRGKLAASRRFNVDAAKGAEGIRHQILTELPRFLDTSAETFRTVQGIGVGFGGPVDDRTRSTIKSHQIDGWDDFPLANWCEENFLLPAALGNDADVAGLAEAQFGAGCGLSPIFYVTVGSGIGGVLVIEGKIQRGCGLGAGEIGHLWVDHDLNAGEFKPAEPLWSILENRASGWSIARLAGETGVEAVAQAANDGSPRAQFILESALRRLALCLSHLLALCCPRRIIIGGGVSLLGEAFFFAPLRRMVAELVFRPFAQCYDIVPAALGEEVVIHGALALARQHLEKNGIAVDSLAGDSLH